MITNIRLIKYIYNVLKGIDFVNMSKAEQSIWLAIDMWADGRKSNREYLNNKD